LKENVNIKDSDKKEEPIHQNYNTKSKKKVQKNKKKNTTTKNLKPTQRYQSLEEKEWKSMNIKRVVERKITLGGPPPHKGVFVVLLSEQH